MRRHHPDRPDLDADAVRDLRAANAAHYVRQLVDSWPPLTDVQKARLAALLMPGTTDREGAGDGRAP